MCASFEWSEIDVFATTADEIQVAANDSIKGIVGKVHEFSKVTRCLAIIAMSGKRRKRYRLVICNVQIVEVNSLTSHEACEI